ncbi:MAG: precorrin-6Y C5,15-methyltransferase (decarboxylating) subunit CbiT, partial [Eggerthellaceae bacterium]|nr:precorrin-6Y C5,15-methyltransferase (decarboxylating) subunit CbiT [Eggerthellaceae bacterium]
SGATALYDRLANYDLEVIPGISSLVYFCAKLRTPWQDATLVSAHGRAHDAVGAIQASAKTFCITGGKTKVDDICRDLVERGLGDVRVSAGERLSYPDERIVRGTAADLAREAFENLSVMLVENEHPVSRPFGAPALSDGDFVRGRAPMTKEEVRSLIVSKLRIAPDHTIWDVGAGTGSVSVEAALAAPRGIVCAIERNAPAIELLRENRARWGAGNIRVVEGEAPSALADLPAPDRVFIGGSSGNLDAIVEAALHANPHVRICATAVTLETMSELLACLRSRGVNGADIVSVSVARADEVGGYHLMRAENPVYIVSAEFEGEGTR